MVDEKQKKLMNEINELYNKITCSKNTDKNMVIAWFDKIRDFTSKEKDASLKKKLTNFIKKYELTVNIISSENCYEYFQTMSKEFDECFIDYESIYHF
jgi:hypothetical protein